MISINMSATQWLAFACRDLVRLADGPAKQLQDKSARRQKPAVFTHARRAVVAPSALVYVAASELPTQQNPKGGLRGPHPWRDVPVIT